MAVSIPGFFAFGKFVGTGLPPQKKNFLSVSKDSKNDEKIKTSLCYHTLLEGPQRCTIMPQKHEKKRGREGASCKVRQYTLFRKRSDILKII